MSPKKLTILEFITGNVDKKITNINTQSLYQMKYAQLE